MEQIKAERKIALRAQFGDDRSIKIAEAIKPASEAGKLTMAGSATAEREEKGKLWQKKRRHQRSKQK